MELSFPHHDRRLPLLRTIHVPCVLPSLPRWKSSAAYLARFTDDSDLPRYSGGSAPTLALSRPSQCSLTLRPARSADPLRGLSIEVLQIIRRLLIRSDRFRLEREFAGPDFHRGERCALPRHTEQSGREFASADPTAGAQDATLQERGLSPEIPLNPRRRLQHFQRPTPSHVSSNTPRVTRRGDDHVARGRRGGTTPLAGRPAARFGLASRRLFRNH